MELSCAECGETKRCYFGETRLVNNDALTDILILLPSGEEPVSITYLNDLSNCLMKYVNKRYGYKLRNYDEESIHEMEKKLQIKLHFPRHEKKFLYKLYSQYYPQLMKLLRVDNEQFS